MPKIKVGMVVHMCNCHPGLVTSCSYKRGVVVCVDLITGKEMGCSIRHCGVYRMKPREVAADIALYRERGDSGLAEKHLGWTAEHYDKMAAEWGWNK